MRSTVAIYLSAFLFCQGCGDEDTRPPLPKINKPYVVSDEVRKQLKTDHERKIAWNTTMNACRSGMEAQRSIGMFDKYNVTDTEITSYCDCMADEAYRGRTTTEIAEMSVNPESGQCRRYYRDVMASEIEL